MKRFIRRRPTASAVIAVIALVFAISGGAIAAGSISVGDFTKKTKKKTVGVGKLTYVTTTITDDDDNFSSTSFKTATATCPAGTQVIGGGIKGEHPEQDFIFDSYPTATGWSGRVFANNGGGTTSTFTTTAICAVSPSVTGAAPSS